MNSSFELLKCQIIGLLENYRIDNEIPDNGIAPEQKVNVEKTLLEKCRINERRRSNPYNNSEERIFHHQNIFKKKEMSERKKCIALKKLLIEHDRLDLYQDFFVSQKFGIKK
jgi:hypothetical protein